MKRAVLLVVVAVALGAFVDVLGDLTQDRPDRVAAGSQSEIVLEVRTRGYLGTPFDAALGLWGSCQGTVTQRLVAPGVVDLGGGQFRLLTDRAVGEHSWRRLQGCLEDARISRVSARVVSKRDLLPGAADQLR